MRYKPTKILKQNSAVHLPKLRSPFRVCKSLEMGGDLGKALPLLVFGAFSLVGGLLTPILPETLHKDLPDTIEDGLKFGR